MYFIIPEDILGTGNPASDTYVYLDNGVSLNYKPTTLVYPFGEDYSLVLPTGPAKRVFSASMSNRPMEEIELIVNYFTYLKGSLINGFSILDESANIRVTRFSKYFLNEDIGSVQASFEEVP